MVSVIEMQEAADRFRRDARSQRKKRGTVATIDFQHPVVLNPLLRYKVSTPSAKERQRSPLRSLIAKTPQTSYALDMIRENNRQVLV